MYNMYVYYVYVCNHIPTPTYWTSLYLLAYFSSSPSLSGRWWWASLGVRRVYPGDSWSRRNPCPWGSLLKETRRLRGRSCCFEGKSTSSCDLIVILSPPLVKKDLTILWLSIRLCTLQVLYTKRSYFFQNFKDVEGKMSIPLNLFSSDL